MTVLRPSAQAAPQATPQRSSSRREGALDTFPKSSISHLDALNSGAFRNAQSARRGGGDVPDGSLFLGERLEPFLPAVRLEQVRRHGVRGHEIGADNHSAERPSEARMPARPGAPPAPWPEMRLANIGGALIQRLSRLWGSGPALGDEEEESWELRGRQR